jgi:hypothetical protein
VVHRRGESGGGVEADDRRKAMDDRTDTRDMKLSCGYRLFSAK